MDLKTFAVAVYSRAGVADACLALQDNYSVDVPLLLFCGWYGICYGRLPTEQLSLARGVSQHLGRHLIIPLRQTRQWMKTQSVDAHTERCWNNLREDIKRAELNAELLMLDTLAATAVSAAGPVLICAESGTTDRQNRLDTIRHNISLIFVNGAAGPKPDERVVEMISAACLDTAQMPWPSG